MSTYLLVTKKMRITTTTSTKTSIKTGTTTPIITAIDEGEPQEPVETLQCVCHIIISICVNSTPDSSNF